MCYLYSVWTTQYSVTQSLLNFTRAEHKIWEKPKKEGNARSNCKFQDKSKVIIADCLGNQPALGPTAMICLRASGLDQESTGIKMFDRQISDYVTWVRVGCWCSRT